MSWIGYITLDIDKTNVGNAVAVWNQGQADEFRYGRRVAFTTAEKNLFVSEAQTALTARSSIITAQNSFASILTTALNA